MRDSNVYVVEQSFRAGGGTFEITVEACDEVQELDENEKARLTSLLVEQWMNGIEIPRLSSDDVLRAKMSLPLPAYERADRLLRLFINRSPRVGEPLDISNHSSSLSLSEQYKANGIPIGANRGVNSEVYNCLSALAWSESITDEELGFLTDYLSVQGLISKGRKIPFGTGVAITRGLYLCKVEVPGFSRTQELITRVDPSQCFIAMSFDDSMLHARESGFKSAVRNAGYRPLIIDEKKDLIGRIDDAIIANIRRSRFVVADFTHRKPEISNGECREIDHRRTGPRGGVYYEAGFAQGLGLRVIFTCHKDIVNDLHFDTRQFNHIAWNDPEDLREKLTDRIVAAIGEGPLKK